MHTISHIACLILAYFVCGWLGLQVAYSGSHITLIWLPTGIALAALWRWGWSMWPGVFIGATLVNLTIGSPLLLAMAIAVGNTLGPALSVLCLKRGQFQTAFNRQRDVLTFITAAALGMLASSILGVANLYLAGVVPWLALPASWLAWWMGDTVGALLAAPILLTLNRSALKHLQNNSRALLLWLVISGPVAWLVFFYDNAVYGQPLPLAFLTLSLLAWAALRLGSTGGGLAVLAFALMAAWGTSSGHGVFHQPDLHTSLFMLWSYITTLVLTSLLVTALLAERRQIEETLRASEQRLRAIVQTEPECVKIIDAQGNLLEMNPAGLAMLEADTLTQAQAHGLINFVEPDHRAGFASLHRRVMRGESGTLTFQVRGLKGTQRWLETHATPMNDTDGNISMLLGITRDITVTRQTEANLRIAALAFEAQIDIMVTDPQGIILRVNQGFIDDSGYSAAEAVGQSPRMLKSGRHDAAFYTAMWASILENGVWQGEIWDRRKSGEIYPKWMTISAVRADDGVVTHYVSTAKDITDRKAAETSLRTSAALLEYSQAASKVGGWELTLATGHLYWTAETYRIHETTPAEFNPSVDAGVSYFLPESRHAISAALQAAIEHGQGYDLELETYTTKGNLITVRTTCLVSMVDGKPATLTGIFQDISAIKQTLNAVQNANRELARSNAELAQFAYAASHDLIEPLRSISSSVQLLQKRYAGKLDARADEFIEHAVNGSQRMQAVIDDLLAFSKIGPGTGTNLSPLEMTSVLAAACANLQTSIKESAAQITHDTLPSIVGNEGQLVRLLQNLIGNAIKFRGDKPALVHVAARHENNAWVFSVADQGIGIEAQYFQHIFALFKRLHSRTEYSGTGVGLALCEKIVNLHHGRIWVESELGKGSVFYFSLPDKVPMVATNKELQND